MKTATLPTPTITAGPITVRATDLRRAFQNAGQAKARNSKAGEASQCLNIEWHPDSLLIVGYCTDFALRAPVAATVMPTDDPWPQDLPKHTTLIRDKDGMLKNLVAAAAKRPGESLVTLLEQNRRTDEQLEGHDWITELVVSDHYGNGLTTTVSTSPPEDWRAFEPYDALPIDAGGIGSIQISAVHANRLGALSGVAHVTVEYLGDQRPVRVRGAFQGMEVLRGWFLPQSLNKADGFAGPAQAFLASIGDMTDGMGNVDMFDDGDSEDIELD